MSVLVAVVVVLLALSFWRYLLTLVLLAAVTVFVVGCVDVFELLNVAATSAG